MMAKASSILLGTLLVFAALALIQAKEDLKEITQKVYLDVEIDGKPAGQVVMGRIGKAVPKLQKTPECFAQERKVFDEDLG